MQARLRFDGAFRPAKSVVGAIALDD